MAKLTHQQIKNHDTAMALLDKPSLTHEDKLYIFENYREEAIHINSKAGAFFTPYGLARDFRLHLPWLYDGAINVLDMCAGIGVLSYAAHEHANSWNKERVNITCIEINPDYVEIGRKILPEANWICGDALSPELLGSLGKFDCAIANPPFGYIHSSYKQHYKSGFFEYMVIEAASRLARDGVFLVPQQSAPFVYSGTNFHEYLHGDCKANRFTEKTGIELEVGVGVDTTDYLDGWHGVKTVCEIVCCDFTKKAKAALLPLENMLTLPEINDIKRQSVNDKIGQQTAVSVDKEKGQQLSLWDIGA